MPSVNPSLSFITINAVLHCVFLRTILVKRLGGLVRVAPVRCRLGRGDPFLCLSWQSELVEDQERGASKACHACRDNGLVTVSRVKAVQVEERRGLDQCLQGTLMEKQYCTP